jgi:hypothetical protein
MTQTEEGQVRDLKKCLDSGDLDGFQKQFVSDMVRRLDQDYDLSSKQSETLESIWKQHTGPDKPDVDDDDDEYVDWRQL